MASAIILGQTIGLAVETDKQTAKTYRVQTQEAGISGTVSRFWGSLANRRIAWLGQEDTNPQMAVRSLLRDPTSNNLAQN
jgi:hypothetical protein